MTRSSVRVGMLAVALAFATVTAGFGQEFRATVKGQGTDQSKGAVPRATVTVQNQETNETATTVTNADGAYTIPFLRPGLYTLSADLTGFQKYTRKDMRLEVGQTALVNWQLRGAALSGKMPATPNRHCSRAAKPIAAPSST